MCSLTKDQTCSLGVSGWHYNQLSYPARAKIPFWRLWPNCTYFFHSYPIAWLEFSLMAIPRNKRVWKCSFGHCAQLKPGRFYYQEEEGEDGYWEVISNTSHNHSQLLTPVVTFPRKSFLTSKSGPSSVLLWHPVVISVKMLTYMDWNNLSLFHWSMNYKGKNMYFSSLYSQCLTQYHM